MGKLSRSPQRKEESGSVIQYAALPWRRSFLGHVEILLVTSRGTGRWVIPKGWPIKGKTASASAEQEAWEEAGVIGHIAPKPIGGYRYEKALSPCETAAVEVEVFPLEVICEEVTWPEKAQRERRWVRASEAAQLVHEPDLQEAIRRFLPLNA